MAFVLPASHSVGQSKDEIMPSPVSLHPHASGPNERRVRVSLSPYSPCVVRGKGRTRVLTPTPSDFSTGVTR